MTAALAGATVWLGKQTRDVSRETGELAKTTAEEIELSRQQAAAAAQQARTAREQFEASMRQRKEDSRPLLHWTLAEFRFAPTPGQNLHAVRVIGNARNHGGIGLLSNLEVHATAPEVHQPMTLHGHPIPPGGDLGIAIRFGPFRGDVDFAFSASWKVDAKSPIANEVLTPSAELECRIFDRGQSLECTLTSQIASPA